MRTLGFVVGVLLICAAAAGQQRTFSEYRHGRLISPTEIAGFHRIFETSEDQQRAVEALVEAAEAELKRVREIAQQMRSEYKGLPKEQRTAAAQEELNQRVAELSDPIQVSRERLLDEVRSILDPDQDQRWPKFEAFWRRELMLFVTSGQHDRTNLLALLDMAGVRSGEDPALDQLVAQFERELDVILIELQDAMDRLDIATPDHDRPTADYEPASHHYEEVSQRLLRHNYHYVNRFAAMLGEPEAAKLLRLYDEATLRESHGSDAAISMLRQAGEADGLDPSAKAKIEAELTRMLPKLEQVNREIRNAEIRHREAKVAGLSLDVHDAKGFGELSHKRYELLLGLRESIESHLTDEQKRAMWKERSDRNKQNKLRQSR